MAKTGKGKGLGTAEGAGRVVGESGEPMRSRWKPEAFEALLDDVGFAIIEHATERDLCARYFAGRADGLEPGVPVRLIVAEPR